MGVVSKALVLPVLVAISAVVFKAVTTPPLGDLVPVDLTGRTYVITGATSGLGQWHAEQLAAWNASLVLPVRDLSRGRELADRLAKIYPNAPQPIVEEMDLNSLASVRRFAERYQGPVDVLVNNAATLGIGEVRRTVDGFEECFQVNYLSSVLLTALLVERIERSPAGRVVHVSAKAHEWANLDLEAMRRDKILGPDFPSRQNFMGNLGGSYADSKLAQMLFSSALNRRLKKPAVSISLHPAITPTELARDHRKNVVFDFVMNNVAMRFGQLTGFMQTREDAPKTQIHVSTHPELQEAAGGRYYSPLAPPLTSCGRAAADCGVSEVSEAASNETLQEDVFSASCDLLGLTDGICRRAARASRAAPRK